MQCKTIPKIRVNYVSGWVGPGVAMKKKLLENRPKISLLPVLIFFSSIPCVFCYYIQC